MNKRFRTGVIAAAVAGGSLLGVAQLGTANAQVGDTDPAEPADEPTDDTERPGRRGGKSLEPLAEILGMDADALREALADGETTLADVATDQGVSVDTVIDELVAAQTERIQAAVDEGRLTQAEADERLADVEERVTTKVNEPRPERGGRGGPGGRLEPVAEALGMESDALAEALRSGSTLADVAADQGVSVESIVGLLVDAATERVNGAVENGRLTQEEADERLAELEERTAERVNEGLPPRGEGDRGPGRGGPGGPGGFRGGEAPADAPADA